MFDLNDFVTLKSGTKNRAEEETENWGGEIFAINKEERLASVAFDAITIDLMSDAYLEYCLITGHFSVEHQFSFDELEKSAMRNTDEEVMAAIDKLVDREAELDVDEEDILDVTNRWVDEFTESDLFNALEESWKDNAGFTAHTFVEHMYNYEYVVPDDWTPANVKSACLNTIPGKVTAEIEVFESYGIVLIQFLRFLGEKKYIDNYPELIEAVHEVKKEIPEVAKDPDNWGMAKSLMMGAIETGVDISDEHAIDQYMESVMSKQLQALSRPPQQSLPPMPNFYKGIGRNQKVSVKYTDGRVVEEIKFKKVEKDLKNGACELIG